MKDTKPNIQSDLFTIRRVRNTDYYFLADMLFEAAFVPEGYPPYTPSLILEPEMQKYYEGWGKPGDFGVIAFEKNTFRRVGAAWCRQFSRANPGYGFIDESTPELTIAVTRRFRRQKVGTLMLESLIKQARKKKVRAISLNVDRRNSKALKMYEKFGFEEYRSDLNHLTMIYRVL